MKTETAATLANPLELITISETCRGLRLSRSGLDKLRVKDLTFPKPWKDGTDRQARVYFVRAEVEAWLLAKLDARAVV
ncbi:transcriptional regulator, AlpA family [Pseudomonas pohangensis]|uniref:Transcriptional regulator, AlpA family n=1 Tax=Pseudomonas pohangensis TaxID=364197 RepID=A0A1H2GMR2_9PSED|nr:transcriptional regulator [Pseudomonas pohangensis]SDU20897.1 transcriptional regulator, AlpA family [Pseudomonas pohangensis]